MRRLLAIVVLVVTGTALLGTASAETPVSITTVSTRADLVSDGDVLVRVTASTRPTVHAGDRDVSSVLAGVGPGVWEGLVVDLPEGPTELVAAAGTSGARLTVTSHPASGPLFSGPHQAPFVCQTEESELGPPLDEDCQAPTRTRWFRLSTADDAFHELEPGATAYPEDTATTTTTLGDTVPFVVRGEAGTINRGIHHILVLDDPIARGWDVPYEPTDGWNRRLQYSFGGGCAVGYRQGTQRVADLVALARGFLGQGYAYATSTLNALGNACNDVLSAETMLMVKERFIETVGTPLYTVGDGGSGGAIMQYMIATAYPGLLDGILPYATFPDTPSVLMSVFDCRLFQRVFDADPTRWTPDRRIAVTGFATPLVCQDWNDLYGNLIVADEGCPEALGDRVYHPENNPDGARCTVWDSNRNVYGLVPGTDIARRPFDNTGVQYGLTALGAGTLLAEDFVVLNEQMGGYDLDGHFAAPRSEADPSLLERLYATGRVVSGDGGLPHVPILDQNLYVAEYAAAGLEVHDRIRAFEIRERLKRSAGGDHQLLLWTYGTTAPGDWGPLMDQWLTGIAEHRRGDLASPTEIQARRPDTAEDRCYIEAGQWFAERAEYGESSRCNTLFPPHATPRMVAGGPVTEDILACNRRPLDRASHPGAFTDDQWARVQAVFPDGVCDWDAPGIGQVPITDTWLAFDASAPRPLGPPPASVPSAQAPPADDQRTPPPFSKDAPLPATGGGAVLAAALLVTSGWRLGRSRRNI